MARCSALIRSFCASQTPLFCSVCSTCACGLLDLCAVYFVHRCSCHSIMQSLLKCRNFPPPTIISPMQFFWPLAKAPTIYSIWNNELLFLLRNVGLAFPWSINLTGLHQYIYSALPFLLSSLSLVYINRNRADRSLWGECPILKNVNCCRN